MKEASIPLLFREHSPLPDIFAAMEGVCDTPLHIYLLFAGDTVMRRVVLYLFFRHQLYGRKGIRPDVMSEYAKQRVR